MSNIYHKICYKPVGVWQQCNNGVLPGNIVLGGSETNGEPLFVGRAIQSGDCITGKVNLSHKGCYVGHGGLEYKHEVYQMLTNPSGSNLVWVLAIGGEVSSGAIQGGEQNNGEKLYIGSTFYNGSLVIGKVHPGLKCLFIAFDHKEIKIENFEVLVCKEICH